MKSSQQERDGLKGAPSGGSRTAETIVAREDGNSILMMTQGLQSCAEVFDLERGCCNEDISFFISMAREIGGPLIEVGCGTGRLSIPLARSGMEVVAVDNSAEMLSRFAEHLAREPAGVRARISLIRADMRRFALKKRFRGAICSSNTLLLLASEEAIGEALACIRSQLAPGGKILIDVAAIDGKTRTALMEYPWTDIPDLAFMESSPDSPLRRTHRIEPRHSANAISIRYRYLDSQGGVRAERREDMVLPLPEELLRVMSERRYEVLDTFGWYDRRPFCETERKLIVVAQKGD